MSLVFDKYEIIRRLAIGGMGEIFLARQKGLAGFERLVILKALLPDLAEKAQSVAEFLDEARIAATLNHPNIVAIHEVGVWDGVYFIAMEYIHGEHLGRVIAGAKRLGIAIPDVVTARVVHDTALALHHAHQAKSPDGTPINLVHRDVSPQNIMVREDGVVKVVDFGIAKANIGDARTATGVVKGKVRYMPPEQLRKEVLDGRSDQYSLGVVFWELLTRAKLFEKEDPSADVRLNAAIDPPSDIVPHVPEELDDICLRMLRPNPDDRFASLAQVVDELGRYLEGHTGEAGRIEVAEFIKKVAGDRIEARTSDLTPRPDNFFVSLAEQAEVATQTRTVGARGRSNGSPPNSGMPRTYLWVAAALLVMFGLFSFFQTGAAPDGERPEISADANKSASASSSEPSPTRQATTSTSGKEPPIGEACVVSVVTRPKGAIVLAGPVVLGMTPLETTALAAGTHHQLSIRKRGYQTRVVPLSLATGERKVIELTLKKDRAVRPAKPVVPARTKPEPKPVAKAAYGFLTIKTRPWTYVSVDDQPIGPTPIFRTRLTTGKHQLLLINEAKKIRATREIVIVPDQTLKLDLKVP